MPNSIYDYLPKQLALFLLWLQNFISVANANLAQTGLTADQVNDLNDLATDLSNAFGVANATRNAAKMATVTQRDARRSAAELARQLAQIVQKHPGATEQLKIDLGLTAPPAPHVPVEPQVPTGLSATVDPQGVVHLKWEANGNKRGTTYVLQTREGSSGPWQYVASMTRRSHKDYGREAGVTRQYRVRAERAAGVSMFSAAAIIYNPGGQSLELNVAA